MKLSDEELKAIDFRNEFQKLLDKYKYELSMSSIADESVAFLWDKEHNREFKLDDSDTNYQIYIDIPDVYDNPHYENLTAKYILRLFDKEKTQKNDNKTRCIFTDNPRKAENIFNNIIKENDDKVIRQTVQNKYLDGAELQLSDGTRYILILSKNNIKGSRCSYAYIDSQLPIEYINYVIIPMCESCSKYDVEII